MSNQDSHELIQMVKDLALELGRTPRRSEFERLPNSRNRMERVFGGYTALIQAAGLEPNKVTARKIDNSIFERDIERHLEEYEPRQVVERKPYPKIAVLGDIHEPFGHPVVKQKFIEFCKENQPDYIVQIGDAVDFLCHSKFPRSQNVYKPKEEEELARKNLEELWSALQKAAPKAKCIMLLGNHAVRPLKRVLESVPSIEHWAEKYLAEYLSFPGVETVMDPREEYMIGDIAFIHGFKSKIGDHRDFLLTNVVCGHIHRGGVNFRAFRGRTFFELNAGLAGDPESKGLSYTSTKTTGWTLGWGYIDRWGPRFVPL